MVVVPVAAVAQARGPRLTLDAADASPGSGPDIVDQALEAVALAASAARAQASAATAASQRISALEASVAALREEARANRELAAQARQRLAQVQDPGYWTMALLAAVLLLTGIAAWLAWRLNGTQRARQLDWQAAAVAEPEVQDAVAELAPSRQRTLPAPFVDSELRAPETTPVHPRPAPAWSDTATASAPVAPPQRVEPAFNELKPPPVAQRTEVMPPRFGVGEGPARDVTIEELIDLEQQAEFFVVLGQDESAVDLLVEHLRHTGGGSPLPYLKLLEIHHRQGHRGEYERLRLRFNQRFNAYAPEWDADMQAGRTLESYAGVVPRLQQVWSRPLDAMAELEALLFRKSRGDLFDLPAYRDVLLLYSLARDLLDREGADTGNVDLLLPLADGGDFSSTAPAPFLGLEFDGDDGPQALSEPTTAPIDLDLSIETARPASIFDDLQLLPQPQPQRQHPDT